MTSYHVTFGSVLSYDTMVKKKQAHWNTFTRFTWICLETDQTLILKVSVPGREMSQENKFYLIITANFPALYLCN